MAIIVTVLNERQSIAALIDAFLSQTLAPDEIVVVDGGSTDGTLETLEGYRERCAGLVKLFVEPGVNIARGRNLAILRSTCELVAVTDGGCRPEAAWLEHLVQPFVDDPGLGAVAGHTRIAGASRFETFAGLMSTTVTAARESERIFHGRNSAFRRTLWQQVGGYPEWLYTAEDTLFCQRAKALGYRVGAADAATVSWRPRPNLRKLAKQYFLYGRGSGRIGRSNLRTVTYHLRNHLVWMTALVASLRFPWLLVVVLGTWVFLYETLARPALAVVRERTDDAAARWYVPLLVLTRSLFNNLGQLYGTWEYRRVRPFRDNLALYLAGQWRTAESKGP